jgi:hypothetical protein
MVGLRGWFGFGAIASAAIALAACGTGDGTAGPTFVDGGTGAPGATTDGGALADGAASATEGGAPDAGRGGILGTLTGSCGLVVPEIAKPSPSLVDNTLTFVAPEVYELSALSPGGQVIFETPNAGGSSTESEVMSFEILRYCEGASLLKTETQIQYQPPDDAGASAITDILVQIGKDKVGVSVTRAYKPPSIPYTDAEAKTLLEKKLAGVVRSTERVLPADRWKKQVLHVFTATAEQTDAVHRVLPAIDPALRADTVVLVTRTVGGGFIYCKPAPALGQECK